MNERVRMNCASTIHVDPEPATVRGWFHNSANPIMDGPVAYCDNCALVGLDFGYFTPGPQDAD